MSGEKTVKLGEACEILNGFAFKSSRYVEEGIRIIRIANVQKGYIEDTSPCFYPYDSEGQISQFMLHEGDLLMSLTGNVGRVGLLEKDMLPAALNQRVACLRLRNSAPLDKSYLFHLLNSDGFEQKCIDASNGVAQKNLSSRWLSSFEVPIVPMHEQKHRSTVLDCITVCLSKLRGEIVILDDLVKSRFVEMFGDGKQTVPLGSVCTFKSGKTLPRQSELESGPVLYAKVGDLNLTGNEMSINTSRTYVSYETARSSLIPSGAVVFPKRGGAIGTNKKMVTSQDCCLDLNLMSVIPGPSLMTEYLRWYFEMIDLNDIANGSTVPQINNKDLEPLEIAVPSKTLQQEFAAFVRQVDKSEAAVQKSIEKLELLKASLMQEYFG